MKQFQIFCPKCGHALGRHRIAISGASDFECTGCKLNFSLTDHGSGKNMELFINLEKELGECFCPICGPDRSQKYSVSKGSFSCVNPKCQRIFSVLQGT